MNSGWEICSVAYRELAATMGTGTHKISLLALILMLAIYWLLNFFGQSILRGLSHTSGFFDMLSVIIVVLIIIRFFS